LRELLSKMNISPRELLRKSEPVYRELGLANRELADDELIDLMVQHPDLMQRPIVERGERAVLGRPVENVKALINNG
jgi:arsenate reductase